MGERQKNSRHTKSWRQAHNTKGADGRLERWQHGTGRMEREHGDGRERSGGTMVGDLEGFFLQ